MPEPVTIAIVLLKLGAIVGEAALSHLTGKATDAGLKGIANIYRRWDREGSERTTTPTVEVGHPEINEEVAAHPEAAAELINDALTMESTHDGVERLELFLAGTFSLLSEVPPGIVAVPGSLCAPDSFTVVDTRGQNDRLQMPSMSEAVEKYLHFTSTYLGVALGVPRMWIGRPPPPLDPASVVERLNGAFSNPPRDRIGRPSPLPPMRFSAQLLAELAELPDDQLRTVGRVQSIYADRVELRAETEADSKPLTLENLADDIAATSRAVVEHADAGLDWDFLQLDADGIRTFRRAVKVAYINGQERKAGTESERRRIQEELSRPLLEGEPESI